MRALLIIGLFAGLLAFFLLMMKDSEERSGKPRSVDSVSAIM